MTVNRQETDQSLQGVIEGGLEYSFSQALPDETFGSSAYTDLIPRPLDSSSLNSAWEFANRLEPDSVGRQARQLVGILYWTISRMQEVDQDDLYFPSLRSHRADDGSVLLEWTSPKFRLGFNIEEDPSQSSWFLVTSEDLRSISAAGRLSENDLSAIAWSFASFLASHS